ncbi:MULTISPECIES: hypothetical protein [unclassified Caballeronia]|nr:MULTISPECIES: hypothetical protein [unclassified Caballeronia]QSN61766.1 hypothetical protein JYK05_02280 [Caballeronia sp. M1242]
MSQNGGNGACANHDSAVRLRLVVANYFNDFRHKNACRENNTGGFSMG